MRKLLEYFPVFMIFTLAKKKLFCEEQPMKNIFSRIILAFTFCSVFILSALCVSQAQASQEIPEFSLRGELYVNGVLDGVSNSSEATMLEMKFFVTQMKDGVAGEEVTISDFQAMHMKFMHLVLISEDMQSFAHVHPFWDKSSRSFNIALNMPTIHPDNQNATKALMKGGKFFVYSEVKSKSLGMHKFSWDLNVEGARQDQEVMEDPRNSSGTVVKYFEDSGAEGNSGDLFRVRFKRSRKRACGGALVQLDIEIDQRNETGVYELATDLKPWMMMGAHALVLGAEGKNASSKNFAHIHGDYSPAGAVYKMSFFDRGQWGNELVRFWLQTKLNGKVRTFPLTFFYEKLNPSELECP